MNLKRIKFYGAGLLALTVLAGSVQAIPITGGISFGGSYKADNHNLALANQIAFGPPSGFGSIAPTFVASTSGTFSTVPLFSIVTMASPISVNPPVIPAGPLWTVGGFSLTLTSLIEYDVHTTSFTLSGTGIMHSTNPALDDTTGTFVATFNDASNVWGWSASNAAVPDGGGTLVLLGSTLVALALPPDPAPSQLDPYVLIIGSGCLSTR